MERGERDSACISGRGSELLEGLALVLVLVSLRREGGDGTALTLFSGRGGPNNHHEVEGGRGGNNHVIVIGWWEGGLFDQIFKLFFNTLEIIFNIMM